MSSQKRQRIRIAVDLAQQGTLVDQITGGIPSLVRGADIQFELGFFLNGALIDITSWATMTVNFMDINGQNGPILTQAVAGTASYLPEGGVAWNTGLTINNWSAGTDQHCIVVFTGAATNIYVSGSQAYLWASLVATSNFIGDTNYAPAGSYVAGAATAAGLVVGASYYWTKGANDTSIVCGSTTLTTSGQFTATATTATLNGSGTSAITATIYENYSTEQQVGYGQSSIIDTGIAMPAPASVFTPTYLTVAAGDARYPTGISLATITANIAALQALTQLPTTYTGSADPNSALLSGKAGDQYVMITGGVYIKTMIKTTGTYSVPSTGGWS
jgi:hypothetical protein